MPEEIDRKKDLDRKISSQCPIPEKVKKKKQ